MAWNVTCYFIVDGVLPPFLLETCERLIKDLRVVKASLPLTLEELPAMCRDLLDYLNYIIGMFVELKLTAFNVDYNLRC